AIAIGSTLFVHEGLVYKWLNLPALAWIGRISYGVYVYQEIFLMHPLHAQHLPRWQMFPLNLVLLFFLATASYYFFERPISRIAHRRFAASRPSAALVTVRDQESTYPELSNPFLLD
ncbi:MAG TPA: hypothetical protein VGU68_16220, partial [Ktedonobacteraceae bacterium]|nr:hypothetical protein [Ktedonobacteraceae bacterium]